MIFIQKMSKQLKNQLDKQQEDKSVWQVHSVFENGVNLVKGNKLLFIGTDKNGELPFAFHLTMRDTKAFLKKIKMSDLFYFDKKAGQLKTSHTTLSFDYLILYDSIMQKQQKINCRQITVAIEEAEKVPDLNGFHQSLPTSLEDAQSQSFFYQKAIGLFSKDSSIIRDSILFFIGRGIGLTPSGDDFLIGVLSIDSAYPIVHKDFRSILIDLLDRDNQTTLISETYLRYAVQHYYSTTLISFAKELTKTRVDNLIKLDFKKILTNGSTSGLDTMTGILCALILLKKREEE